MRTSADTAAATTVVRDRPVLSGLFIVASPVRNATVTATAGQ
jgi:hypothetical protein